MDDSADNPVVTTLSQARRINPVNMYTNQTFEVSKAQIVSKNTKILASPTLILNEFPGNQEEKLLHSQIYQKHYHLALLEDLMK